MYSLDDLLASNSVRLYKEARSLIPGGTQLLSKRPEMFAPDIWPSYYSKAKGFKVWDLDGRIFNDMSIMGVGACILGYADEEIDDSVVRAIKDGVSSTLNCAEEVTLAQELINLHPWFDMVRYTRSGGEAMSLAIRIARAKTSKEKIFFSGYHGWCDWYLAANIADKENLDGQLMPGLDPCGVPRGLKGTSEPFNSNSIDDLISRAKGHEGDIAAIVIEPARGEDAPIAFLEELRSLATEWGAILIFDEITSGYRACPGGLHRNYKVFPDMAVFAKSMANGYAMSAILGKKFVMEAAQKTFISSTNWTDRVGPVAALATLKKYCREEAHTELKSLGLQVKKIWGEASKKHSIPIKISGLDALPSFAFNSTNSTDLETFFTVEMLKKGFLGFRQFRPSLAHESKVLNLYKNATNDIFSKINDLQGNVELFTPSHHTGFTKLTSE